MTHRTNPHEARARLVKADRLMAALDADMAARRRDPVAEGATVAAGLRALTADHPWLAALARSAGTTMPSLETVELLAQRYEGRACRARRVA